MALRGLIVPSQKESVKTMAEVSTKVITPECRFNWVRVFEPTQDDQGNWFYSIQMIFKKEDDLKQMKAAAEAAMAKKFGADKSKWPKGYRSPFRDGDEERDGKEYVGTIFMNAKTKIQPGVVDQNLQPIMSADDFYSGCYGRASITFFGYEAKGNKGVGVGLNNLMKTRDGERLDGRKSAEEDFADFASQTASSESGSGFDGNEEDDVPF